MIYPEESLTNSLTVHLILNMLLTTAQVKELEPEVQITSMQV